MSDIKEQAEALAEQFCSQHSEQVLGGGYMVCTTDVNPALAAWIEYALRLRESLSALVAQTARHDRRDHMCSQCAAIDEARAQIAAHDKLVKGAGNE